jgi:hypothetical protein
MDKVQKRVILSLIHNCQNPLDFNNRSAYACKMKELNLIMMAEIREWKHLKCKYGAPSHISVIRLKKIKIWKRSKFHQFNLI